MQAIDTDVDVTSISLYVDYDRELCKNGWTTIKISFAGGLMRVQGTTY